MKYKTPFCNSALAEAQDATSKKLQEIICDLTELLDAYICLANNQHAEITRVSNLLTQVMPKEDGEEIAVLQRHLNKKGQQ